MAAGDYLTAVADDLKALEALAAGLEGSGKPFVGTGGTLMLAFGGIAGRAGTEQDVLTNGPRVDAENLVIGLAGRGVRSSSSACRRSCTARSTTTASPTS